MNSEKFLGYGINCDTSEPDYTKADNDLFNSFTAALNNLCKPFPIIFADIYSPLHSLWFCLIMSCVFSLASLALIYGCT